MRKALALFVVTILLLCMIQSPAEAAETDHGTIFGTIVDTNDVPMQNVTIAVKNTTTDVTFFGVSNRSGAYELNVPNGTYNITVSFPNFTTNMTYVNISVPQMLGPYNFTMTELFGKVVGSITDNDGPVYNVLVTLSNDKYNYTAMSTQLFGGYEISGIKPGMYVAFAEKRGYNRGSYPAPIEIEVGVVLNINFTLESQPAIVFGSISKENDRSLGDVKVTLSAKDGALNTFTFSDSDGNYTIAGLSAGSYEMTFEKEGYETVVKVYDFNPYESKRVDITLIKIEKNATTVLFGYDLTHSLMVIGFFAGLALVLFGVIVSIRSQKKPEILEKIWKDDEDK